jgi:putative transposase
VRRSYKFRLRPTAGQHVALQACLDAHRELYNAALEERRLAWKRRRKGVSYGTQSSQLKDIRSVRADIGRWSFSSQQTTLRRLNKAFAAFFRRAKGGQTPGYPRFKSKDRFDSVEWPKDGDGCRWKPEHNQVYLQGIGTLKVSAHRPVEGDVKTVAVKREGRRWFLILACDDVPPKLLPATGVAVGVDVGIASFLTTSDGEHVVNPRHGRNPAAHLEHAQAVLARKQRGSKNRRAARETVAGRHRKIASQRRDFHHQIARKLVNDYDVIVLEDLEVKNMCRSASGTVDAPGTNVAAKRGLNRSILDAGWAAFASILAGKAEEAGRLVVKVDPRRTSLRCSSCGHIAAENRVSQAVFRCQRCGFSLHADVNAARNILRAGLALPAVAVEHAA